MTLNKAITFNEDEIGTVSIAGISESARSEAETEFIEQLKLGEAEAFDTLVTRYTPAVYGLLYRITHDREEAGDLTQETFLRAYKSIAGFRGDSEIKTWLFRVAINLSKNRFWWWKARKRDKTTSLDSEVPEGEMSLLEKIPSDDSSPLDNLLSAEREALIFDELNKLPDTFKEAVILRDVEGLRYEEIAAVLEISIGTVKSRISRGREELRKRLTDI
ncbi:MAG: sigma-70 family RNA polymerase sigma factor [Pyrinomonadaceae bacterium]